MRLEPLREQIGLPVLVINDSPIKQFAENRHAVGQSTVESYLRITNRSTNGKRVTVFGYGACGRGVAAHFRNAFAEVSVVEVDPVTRLEALLDGFAVPGQGRRAPQRRRRHHGDRRPRRSHRRRPAAARRRRVLMNVGHFPLEIDVPGARGGAAEARTTPATGSRRSSSPAAAGCTCSPAGTWSTSPGRARSGTRSSRWTSASRCRRAASRPSPAASRAGRLCRSRSAGDRRGSRLRLRELGARN